VPGVLGIHLEGPYIAPARKGTHDAGKFRVPDADEIAMATALDNGVTLITLAPEQVPAATIRAMVERGAIVCAGHTAASYEKSAPGIEAGITGFTHLYNAMTPLQGREPGAVGAALEDDDSWCGVIVDGVHVHPASLRVALAAKPRGKVLLVTDAMPMVGADDPSFDLYGETITAVDGVVRNAAGALAGSALDMASAVRNSVHCSACRWTKPAGWPRNIRRSSSALAANAWAASRRAIARIWYCWMARCACSAAGLVAGNKRTTRCPSLCSPDKRSASGTLSNAIPDAAFGLIRSTGLDPASFSQAGGRSGSGCGHFRQRVANRRAVANDLRPATWPASCVLHRQRNPRCGAFAPFGGLRRISSELQHDLRSEYLVHDRVAIGQASVDPLAAFPQRRGHCGIQCRRTWLHDRAVRRKRDARIHSCRGKCLIEHSCFHRIRGHTRQIPHVCICDADFLAFAGCGHRQSGISLQHRLMGCTRMDVVTRRGSGALESDPRGFGVAPRPCPRHFVQPDGHVVP
jgi:hypothetical protein